MTRKKNKNSARITGEQAWDNAYARCDHTPLKQALGVEIDDSYLRLALTHRSFAHENGGLSHNERLEFLGDAVLGLAVATRLFELHPHLRESELSKIRAAVVSRYGCAAVARDLGLGAYLLLGRGELSSGGRDRDSILADTVEALLGAVARQYDYETARQCVLRLFDKYIVTASSKARYEDWKTVLQERAAVLEFPVAEYRSTKSGPEHDLEFSTDVYIAGVYLGSGTGPNKKTSERYAAQQAVAALQGDGSKARRQTIREAIANGYVQDAIPRTDTAED